MPFVANDTEGTADNSGLTRGTLAVVAALLDIVRLETRLRGHCSPRLYTLKYFPSHSLLVFPHHYIIHRSTDYCFQLAIGAASLILLQQQKSHGPTTSPTIVKSIFTALGVVPTILRAAWFYQEVLVGRPSQQGQPRWMTSLLVLEFFSSCAVTILMLIFAVWTLTGISDVR